LYLVPSSPVPSDLVLDIEHALPSPGVGIRIVHIPPGNYGNGETQETITKKVVSIDLETYQSPFDLFSDPKIPHFDYSTAEGIVKNLVAEKMYLEDSHSAFSSDDGVGLQACCHVQTSLMPAPSSQRSHCFNLIIAALGFLRSSLPVTRPSRRFELTGSRIPE
jgi:hypothetical protein